MEDAWLSIGDIGTWHNGITLYSMHEKAYMNIYMNNFWLKKCEKGVTGVRKGKTKGVFLVNERQWMFCMI